MKTNTTINAQSAKRNAVRNQQTMLCVLAVIQQLAMAAQRSQDRFVSWREGVLQRIRRYYSRQVEQELTRRQTLCIINAQCAFATLIVCSAAPLWIVVACLLWTASALLRCRRAFQ